MVLFLSCSGPITENEFLFHEDPVIAVPASISLNPPTVTVDYPAGREDSTLVVTDQERVEVFLTEETSSWLSCSYGNGKLKILTTKANPHTKERTGVVTLIAGEGVAASSAEFSVVQGGCPAPIIALSHNALSIGSKVGNVAILQITDTNLEEIEVYTDADWLKAELSGLVITVTVLESNPLEEKRSAILTIDGKTLKKAVTVTQSEKIPDSLVGKTFGDEGVFFWRNPDNPYEYKIVSAKSEKRAWGPATPAGCASSSFSGEEACANIRANSDYSTSKYALQFCDDLGEGWRMPTQAEAEDLFEAYNSLRFDAKKGPATQAPPASITTAEKEARAAFDAAMNSIGGVLLNNAGPSENGESLWLCQENSTGTNAWYFRFGAPGCTHGSKTSTSRYVRCIKSVTVK